LVSLGLRPRSAAQLSRRRIAVESLFGSTAAASSRYWMRPCRPLIDGRRRQPPDPIQDVDRGDELACGQRLRRGGRDAFIELPLAIRVHRES
jgi:hypothetical protein